MSQHLLVLKHLGAGLLTTKEEAVTFDEDLTKMRKTLQKCFVLVHIITGLVASGSTILSSVRLSGEVESAETSCGS